VDSTRAEWTQQSKKMSKFEVQWRKIIRKNVKKISFIIEKNKTHCVQDLQKHLKWLKNV
jgi:hypothetical protein